MRGNAVLTEYGRIACDFKCDKLETICVGKAGVQTGPFGSQLHKEDYVDIGTPIITVEHLLENRISHVGTPFVTDQDRKRLFKYSLEEGDIVFSRVGSVDRRSLVREAEDGWLFSGRCLRVRVDKTKIDPSYLSYFFGHEGFKNYIRSIAVGATMPSINTKILSDINIYYPDIEAQKAIAHILSSLDDKIELNRQMNVTLEAMAQALFKSWFVDFDPVIDNAMAAGNPIPEPFHARAETRKALGDKCKPLPEEIQKQFPSSFVFSGEMGWIPEGWEVIAISKMVESISDTYPLGKVDEVIFLNTRDILEGKFLHSDFSSVSGLPGQAKKSIKAGDILFSEIRPKNKRFAFVCFDAKDYVVSTKLMVLRASGRFKPLFPYFLLKQETNIEYLQHIAESRSGTFPQITYKQLDQIVTTVPKDNALIEYFTSNVLEGAFNKSLLLENQSASLEKTRDTLLPKLLSGQLRIPDPEKRIQEAG